MQTQPESTPWRGRLAGVPRGVKWLIYTVYLSVLVVLGIELFWWLRFGTTSVPAAEKNTEAVWQLFYKQLWTSGAIDAPTAPDDTIDILLLGGSVLEQTAPLWEQAVAAHTGKQVRVYNLAVAAHTTRDSRMKYEYLQGRHFDWIVVYHGINDVRMNYASDEQFRDDYTHCAWYYGIQKRLKEGRVTFSALTTTIAKNLTDFGSPAPDQYDLGRKLRTPKPFGDNIRAIVEQALESESQVLLMTFAWYVPDGYTREAFGAGQLDYGDGEFSMPVENWGEPSQVVRILDAQNDQVRQLQGEYSDTDRVVTVDQASLLKSDGTRFSDVCHLTREGCAEFVARASPLIQSAP